MSKTDIPEDLLDEEGYPTNEWLNFLIDYEPDVMPILDLIELIKQSWHFGDWGYKIDKNEDGTTTLELHTGGWSGNEDIISAIKSNVYLTQFQLKYVMWKTGGHYYFEIND